MLYSSTLFDMMDYMEVGKYMRTEVVTAENGVTINCFLRKIDKFPYAVIVVEFSGEHIVVHMWYPDDVQNDPTKTTKIPLDLPLKWDRLTGEDIHKGDEK